MVPLNRRLVFFALGITLFGWALPLYSQTLTPNPSLTPPCGIIGTLGSMSGNQQASTSAMRASVYNLNGPATIYTITVYSNLLVGSNPQAPVAIYHGSPAAIGSFILQSAPHTALHHS